MHDIKPNNVLYLVSLRSYSDEIDSFILALKHLKGDQAPWFDIAILCSEKPIDSRGYEDSLNCRVYCIHTPVDGGIYGKLPFAAEVIDRYSYICVCTADDVWSIGPDFIDKMDGGLEPKVICFNFLCAQPIPSRRLLLWNGFQQLQLASKIVSMEDRLKNFASQGPMTVHSIYSRSYLLDLISAIDIARIRLFEQSPIYVDLIEDLINVANLAVGFASSDRLWSLRYMNSNYARRSDFLLSVETIRRLEPSGLSRICEIFFSKVLCHMPSTIDNFQDRFSEYVGIHAMGYAAANSRFYREGFDVLLCTAEDVAHHNISFSGRKGWPVRVLRSGAVGSGDLPIASIIREPQPLALLNLPKHYWSSLRFEEWTGSPPVVSPVN